MAMPRDVRPLLPPVPSGWKIFPGYDGRSHPPPVPPGYVCVHPGGLKVIVSIDIQADWKAWLHVSFSYSDHLPSYEDIKNVKSLFIGDDRCAYQVFPPVDEHVNIHEFCLHLYSCLDGRPLPDFRPEPGKL